MPVLKSEALKHCLNCGKELFGRTDKKFCNDGCRNQFNREKNQRGLQSDHENLPEILKVIRQNYELLKKYAPEVEETGIYTYLPLDRLKADGFHPKFITSCRWLEGKFYRFCFELGFYIEGEKVTFCRLQSQAETECDPYFLSESHTDDLLE